MSSWTCENSTPKKIDGRGPNLRGFQETLQIITVHIPQLSGAELTNLGQNTKLRAKVTTLSP